MHLQRLFRQNMVGLACALVPAYAFAAKPAPIPPTQAVPGLHAVTAELEAEDTLKKALPESLNRPDVLRALRLRKDVPLALYTPILGAMNAPITLVEFNDLNCLQCRDGLKLADSIFQKHKNAVRLAHRYAPFDRKASTNLAAFYSKLAQQQNMFWQFRAALANLTEFTPATLGKVLTEVGVSPRMLRQDFFPNARIYYTQLDEDAALAEDLKIKVPPQLFLAGMKIGEDLKPEDVDPMIDFLTNPKGQAALKQYDAVMKHDNADD